MGLLVKHKIQESIKRNEALRNLIEDYLTETNDVQSKIIDLLIFDYLTLEEEKGYLKSICTTNKIDYDRINLFISYLVQEFKRSEIDLEIRENKVKFINIIEDNFKCLYKELYTRAFKESIAIVPRLILGDC